MIQIRGAKLEDRDKVFELLRQLMLSATGVQSAINGQGASETFRKIINEGQGAILVAEEDDRLLGLVTLSYPLAVRCGGLYACIEEFIVGDSARGKGVGGKLLEAAIQKAREKGCFELQVNRPSELGYPVYLRHGWQDLGKHLNLYPQRQGS
jgi:GNAT superfamily N-acetyltransferase